MLSNNIVIENEESTGVTNLLTNLLSALETLPNTTPYSEKSIEIKNAITKNSVTECLSAYSYSDLLNAQKELKQFASNQTVQSTNFMQQLSSIQATTRTPNTDDFI